MQIFFAQEHYIRDYSLGKLLSLDYESFRTLEVDSIFLELSLSQF